MVAERVEENYIYNGLGFPILLKNARFTEHFGEWLLKIDVIKVAGIAIAYLPTKPSGLTGGEVRFARTYFDLSKRALAGELNVSHTAVNKWEANPDKKAPMDTLTEIAFRSFIQLRLEDKDFANFYRTIMDEAKNFSKSDSEPLKIAV